MWVLNWFNLNIIVCCILCILDCKIFILYHLTNLCMYTYDCCQITLYFLYFYITDINTHLIVSQFFIYSFFLCLSQYLNVLRSRKAYSQLLSPPPQYFVLTCVKQHVHLLVFPLQHNSLQMSSGMNILNINPHYPMFQGRKPL